MTKPVDPAAILDSAATIRLEGVWKPQGRPVDGGKRVEARWIAQKPGKPPREVLIEYRRRRTKPR